MKKFMIFSMAALALSMASCSSGEDKVNAKKDAEDMAKALVDVIDKTEVKNQAGLDSLKQKVDSMEVTFYKFYDLNKKDANGKPLTDSLKIYYNQNRAKVDSALNAKTAAMQKNTPAANK
jgi:hypothetical protein